MHKHFQKWLIRTLAATVLCGAATVTKAQYNYPSVPSQSGYGPAIDPAASQPFAQASTTENYTAFSPAPDNSDLAKRLADVEKALKKMDDKAKADKAAAAQVPSVKVGGRVQWDTDTFNQNATSRTTAGDALNGSEFRRLYLGAYGAMFDILDYKC